MQPPPTTIRPHNYWMMNKKVVSLPFTLFSSGFALALFAIFVPVFDLWSLDSHSRLIPPYLAYAMLFFEALALKSLSPYSPAWAGVASVALGTLILLAVRLNMFRTLGQNPLAAYIIHHMVEGAVLSVVPKDALFWYGSIGLAVFFLISYEFVRYLEKQGFYLRL